MVLLLVAHSLLCYCRNSPESAKRSRRVCFRAFIVTFSSQTAPSSPVSVSSAGAISPVTDAVMSLSPPVSAEQLLSIKKFEVSIFTSGVLSPLAMLCLYAAVYRSCVIRHLSYRKNVAYRTMITSANTAGKIIAASSVIYPSSSLFIICVSRLTLMTTLPRSKADLRRTQERG